MLILVKAERKDENNELCRGQNLGFVACVDTAAEAQSLAVVYLVHNNEAFHTNVKTDGKEVTLDDVKISILGTAEPDIERGIILMHRAGS